MHACDQSSIFSTGGKFCPDYGLLLDLHALTLYSRLFLCSLVEAIAISFFFIFIKSKVHSATFPVTRKWFWSLMGSRHESFAEFYCQCKLHPKMLPVT